MSDLELRVLSLLELPLDLSVLAADVSCDVQLGDLEGRRIGRVVRASIFILTFGCIPLVRWNTPLVFSQLIHRHPQLVYQIILSFEILVHHQVLAVVLAQQFLYSFSSISRFRRHKFEYLW